VQGPGSCTTQSSEDAVGSSHHECAAVRQPPKWVELYERSSFECHALSENVIAGGFLRRLSWREGRCVGRVRIQKPNSSWEPYAGKMAWLRHCFYQAESEPISFNSGQG
jgi:hypothetical protein